MSDNNKKHLEEVQKSLETPKTKECKECKIDFQTIQPVNIKANWSNDKKLYIEEAQKQYPHLDLYFIETCYDFCEEHKDDSVLFKYMQGKTEHMKLNQLKRCESILNNGEWKIERCEIKDEILGVEIKGGIHSLPL